LLLILCSVFGSFLCLLLPHFFSFGIHPLLAVVIDLFIDSLLFATRLLAQNARFITDSNFIIHASRGKGSAPPGPSNSRRLPTEHAAWAQCPLEHPPRQRSSTPAPGAAVAGQGRRNVK
jgi:hypothetical protein